MNRTPVLEALVANPQESRIAFLRDGNRSLAFAITGSGPETKVIAHGVGRSDEEAAEAMTPCPFLTGEAEPPKAKPAPRTRKRVARA